MGRLTNYTFRRAFTSDWPENSFTMVVCETIVKLFSDQSEVSALPEGCITVQVGNG